MISKKQANTSFSHSANVIAISSGKGGVGKSNIALNLSISLAQIGQKVCLFDADINLANINILLGITPQYTLQHLFTENKTINQIITLGPAGIDIIAGASGVAEFAHLTTDQQHCFIEAIKQLEKNYDYLLIDTAAGIDNSTLSFLNAVPYLVIVITKEPTSLTDAFSLLKVLSQQGYNQSILVIVNMVTTLKIAKHIFSRFEFAVKKYLNLSPKLVGYIIKDDNVLQAVENQQALMSQFPDSAAAHCINDISMRLHKAIEKISESTELFTDFFESQIYMSADLATGTFVKEEPRIEDQKLLTEISHLSDSQTYSLFKQLQLKFPCYTSQSDEQKNRENGKHIIKQSSNLALNMNKKTNQKKQGQKIQDQLKQNRIIELKQAIIYAAKLTE